MEHTSKATVSGVLDIAAGVFGLMGGFVLLVLGLAGGGILSKTVPPELRELAILPLALFLPLACLILASGACAVAGGFAALQRRRWVLAVAGSVGALICCLPLGIPAMIFTVLAEGEFAPS